MRVQKKTLVRWLNNFVSIVTELSGEAIKHSVNVGKGVILCPSDIFEVLKNRRVVCRYDDQYLLSYTGDFGETFIEVRADSNELSGLTLKIKHSENDA